MLLARRVSLRGQGRVQVDDSEVEHDSGGVALYAKDDEAFGRTVEEVSVPPLAFLELCVFLLAQQCAEAHLAEHADEVGDKGERLLQALV